MKGIREAAMGTPEPATPTYSSGYSHSGHRQGSIYDYDDYGYDTLPTQSYKETYKPAPDNQIVISFTIPNSQLGECADDSSPLYNWNVAHHKATEKAYDKVEELLGKNYEGRFTVSFDVVESISEYEAIVTLIPSK